MSARWLTVETCPSGKRGYVDRRTAKHALTGTQALGHMRPYRCPDCRLWHVGHLPAAVLRGVRTAAEHYRPPDPQEGLSVMTAPVRPRITFLNATWEEIEAELRAGKNAREVADYLGEPIPNVMGVWAHLRDTGTVEPRNMTATPPPPSTVVPPAPTGDNVTTAQQPDPPRPPRHTPNPDLTQAIADTTGLLVRAADIDNRRIQAALGRARKALTDLAGLVTDWEGKGRLRAEIAKHEAQIRVLKAELNGTPAADTAGVKKPLSDAQRANLARMREAANTPVDCPDCGQTFRNKPGLSSHQRGGKCTGRAA